MTLDLDAYFERVGYAGPREARLDVLRALHRLHPAAIPFENLTTLLGETPALDVASLERKLVSARRGGYCFEQNRLFAAALEALGFDLTALAARVLWGRPAGTVGARTHMLLAVRLDGRTHVADVGFGGLTLTAPLLLEPGLEQATPHERFRALPQGGGFVLEADLSETADGGAAGVSGDGGVSGDAGGEPGARWRPLYWFDLTPHLEIDFTVLNHYVATHASSPFPRTLMAARALPDRRLALQDNRFTVRPLHGEIEQRVLESGADVRRVLAEDFGIALPSGVERVLERAAAPGADAAGTETAAGAN
ncbi:MAG TPA: arylamine N-acetyltransferase [Gammaproteobacteria bacterium]|nr:arylamine N-acetyltransferase [Gammaproteobacteria bacterium]